MKVNATLLKVYPERTGKSKKTNEEWRMTDVTLEWEVSEPGCSTYTQSVVGTCKKSLNVDTINEAIRDKRKVACTVYFDAREWKGSDNVEHGQTSVNLFLPKDYYKE